jgi:hypothetical protein
VREITKKLTVISVLLLFLVSGFAGASFASIKDNPSDDSVNNEIVTLYRYGPDGTITPVSVNIACQEEQNLDDIIAEKCSELLDKDLEIKNYVSITDNVTTLFGLSRIKSSGVGLHWKSPLRFRIPLFVMLRFRLFQDVPLKYKILGINVIPLVHCNYMNDENASTNIETIPTPFRPDKETMSIEGKHNVTALFFFGYTYWRGTRANWFDDSGKSTGFDGYAYIIKINKKTPGD